MEGNSQKKPTVRRVARAASASKASAPKRVESAFRVGVRCRPLLPHERVAHTERVLQLSRGTVTLLSADDAERAGSSSPRVSPRRERERLKKAFAFDHVYDENCSQAEVYDEFVKPFTAKFLEGYNVTLFAYGQTGTGKT